MYNFSVIFTISRAMKKIIVINIMKPVQRYGTYDHSMKAAENVLSGHYKTTDLLSQ
jgi:hypothetical protein